MFGLLVDLRRRLLRPYLFLATCSVTEPIIVEALALGLDLGLVATWMLEAGLRRSAPI